MSANKQLGPQIDYNTPSDLAVVLGQQKGGPEPMPVVQALHALDSSPLSLAESHAQDVVDEVMDTALADPTIASEERALQFLGYDASERPEAFSAPHPDEQTWQTVTLGLHRVAESYRNEQSQTQAGYQHHQRG